jgi:ribosomal protein L20
LEKSIENEEIMTSLIETNEYIERKILEQLKIIDSPAFCTHIVGQTESDGLETV